MRPRPAPDRVADRDFSLPRPGSRQQKVRHVDARDQQHERHGSEQGQQPASHVADHSFLKPRDLAVLAPLFREGPHGVGLPHLRCEGAPFRFQLSLQWQTRQPGDAVSPLCTGPQRDDIAAIGTDRGSTAASWRRGTRRPEASPRRRCEAPHPRGPPADDSRDPRQIAAARVRDSAPSRRRARVSGARDSNERPPERGRHAEDREEVRRHLTSGEPVGAARVAEKLTPSADLWSGQPLE